MVTDRRQETWRPRQQVGRRCLNQIYTVPWGESKSSVVCRDPWNVNIMPARARSLYRRSLNSTAPCCGTTRSSGNVPLTRHPEVYMMNALVEIVEPSRYCMAVGCVMTTCVLCALGHEKYVFRTRRRSPTIFILRALGRALVQSDPFVSGVRCAHIGNKRPRHRNAAGW